MCKISAIDRFCDSFDSDRYMLDLQELVSDRINFAVEHAPDDKTVKSEIYRIVVDVMFEYHTEQASSRGKLTPNNLYPTDEERKQFAKVVLRNLVPNGLVYNECSLMDLNDELSKIQESLKELQEKEEFNRNIQNNK